MQDSVYGGEAVNAICILTGQGQKNKNSRRLEKRRNENEMKNNKIIGACVVGDTNCIGWNNEEDCCKSADCEFFVGLNEFSEEAHKSYFDKPKTEDFVFYEVRYLVDRGHKHYVPACKTFTTFEKAMKWSAKHCLCNSYSIIILDCKKDFSIECDVVYIKKK